MKRLPSTRIALLISVIVLIAISIYVYVSASTPAVGQFEGFLAIDFTLSDLNGNKVTLSALRGRPVMLNFWSTGCPPCRYEMPDIEKVYRKIQELPESERGVILAINLIDTERSLADVAKFVKEGGYSFPVLLDERSRVFTNYLGRAIPISIFIDADGIIRHRQIGMMNEEMIRAAFAKAGLIIPTN